MASHTHHHEPHLSDKPKISSSGSPPTIGYGSDAIAYQLSRLDLKYIALVPGSSYRGLHDSIVNFSNNANPEMLVTLHEEHAVSIAHGYAKVTGKPMAAAVHANVGLMHATMAVYNAFCDRVPILILGATGPLDAQRRRPWIDWIHTAQDQGALVRPYVKFDDQPHGANAAVESLLHATVAAASKPCAPSYVCLDLGLQEDAVDPETLKFPDTKRYLQATEPAGPAVEDVLKIIAALSEAKRPLFMFGRMAPNARHWDERVQLVEKFDGRVITDLKQTAPFPFPHRCQPSAPAVFLTPQTSEMIRDADLIISFDWVDLAGNLKAACGSAEPNGNVISISMDSALHNGWSKDHFALPPADISIFADVDKTMTALLTAAEAISPQRSHWPEPAPINPQPASSSASNDIFMPDLAEALYSTMPSSSISLVRVPLGWRGPDLQATHLLSFMGMDGGAGIASGPGQVVGTSLALQSTHSPLTAVAILGDGEYLMGSSALWTAARCKLPLLVIVANNGSYFNDEVHQERVAKHRGREVENKWIGMRLDDPQPNLHKIAEGLGCVTVRREQVKLKSDLAGAMSDAAREVQENKKAVVLDVRVLPEGYSSAMSEKAR